MTHPRADRHLEQAAARIREHLAGRAITVTVEHDHDLQQKVVRVAGLDNLGRAAWGQYAPLTTEPGDEDLDPSGDAVWTAHNEDGQTATDERGNLEHFARWWQGPAHATPGSALTATSRPRKGSEQQ